MLVPSLKYQSSLKLYRLKWLLETLESGRREVSEDDDFKNGGVLSIGGEHIGWQGELFLDKAKYISTQFYQSMSSGKIKSNDVLLVKDGATIGKVAIIRTRSFPDAAVNEHVFILRFSKDQDPRFHFYSLQSSFVRDQIKLLITGAAQPGLNSEFKNKVFFPSPDYTTQCLIADYLDRETGRIDALMAEKEKMLALLEEKRQALISRVVTKGLNPNVPMKPSGLDWLGEVPAHWGVVQLKHTWASADYGLSVSIREGGEITVLRMNCIIDGRIDLSKAGTIEEADKSILLRKGDLLFNRTNSIDQVAKVGLLDFNPVIPVTFASYLVRIRTNHRAEPDFLVYLLNSREFLNFARKNAIPAIGQANLSPSRYGEIHIPLPEGEEQKEIVQFLNKETEFLTSLSKEIQNSIDLLKERRAALITAAVTGQIPIEEMRK